MKRAVAAICCVILAGTLAACGGAGLKRSVYSEKDFDTSGDVVMKTEYDVYGSDAPMVSFTIANNTGADLMYGEEFRIEVSRSGRWYEVPFPENLHWNLGADTLMAYETKAHVFMFSMLNYKITDGRYRLVKEIGEKLYAAAFRVGKSPITAETPFGFKPLDGLPKAYSPEEAAANGDIVITQTEIVNAGKFAEFVGKAAIRLPAMVRNVQFTAEGGPSSPMSATRCRTTIFTGKTAAAAHMETPARG
jgi:hypothetical protein